MGPTFHAYEDILICLSSEEEGFFPHTKETDHKF